MEDKHPPKLSGNGRVRKSGLCDITKQKNTYRNWLITRLLVNRFSKDDAAIVKGTMRMGECVGSSKEKGQSYVVSLYSGLVSIQRSFVYFSYSYKSEKYSILQYKSTEIKGLQLASM